MLEVESLQVAYGKIPALRDISLHIDEGELVGVVGHNGAGKSTLLLTIAGVIKPSAGDIQFDGESIVGMWPERIVRRGISLVPENRHIFPQLTVEGNLRLGATVQRRSGKGDGQLEAVLEHFPVLKRYFSVPAGRLSGGEQQQLAIGRALLADPKLLMLDEPSLGLAPLVIDEVFQVLQALRERGATVLLVEQNVARTLEVADRVYTLQTGGMEFAGTPEELARSEGFEARYLGLTD